ncbi:MAG TPA: RNA 2',3'-cyclic phosphodiesterase [Dehalococcoidia bacterium]|nr:RNA 2',3'-cyclic phosphodiesterase [Dehalococcoidia bacterium]
MRLFIAVFLPESWHTALAARQAELRARLGTAARALRWVRPEGSHLTLVFLGETEQVELAAIEAAMQTAAGATRPFALRLGTIGTFGGARPRVLHVGVDGETAALAALQGRLAAALQRVEERPFSPHITLARVPRPDRATGEAIARALAEGAAASAPPLAVERISLMQSELRPGGAVYTERLAVLLAGPP